MTDREQWHEITQIEAEENHVKLWFDGGENLKNAGPMVCNLGYLKRVMLAAPSAVGSYILVRGYVGLWVKVVRAPNVPAGLNIIEVSTKAPTPPKKNCCDLRRKVLIGVVAVLPESQCGIPDSALLDVTTFGLNDLGETDKGTPILHVRFCAWCGEPRAPGDEVHVTEVMNPGARSDMNVKCVREGCALCGGSGKDDEDNPCGRLDGE